MKIAFIADPLGSFKTYKDSTLAMMEAAAARGHVLFALEPRQLFSRGGRVLAMAAPITQIAAREGGFFQAGERA